MNTDDHATNAPAVQRTRTPKVSIGLPVYNGEPYLRESIESVLAQDFEDFELLISDNASTDGTWEICQDYAKIDSRIRLQRNGSNLGAIDNFALTLRLTTAPYFMWMAHDDRLQPEYVSSCLRFLEVNPDYVLCCAQNTFIDESGREIKSPLADFNLDSDEPHQRYLRCLASIFDCPNAFYGLLRRSAMDVIGYNGPVYGRDTYLVLKLSLYGKFKQIDEMLRWYRLRLQPSSVTGPFASWWVSLSGPNVPIPVFPRLTFFVHLLALLLTTDSNNRTKAKLVTQTLMHGEFSYWTKSDLVHMIARLTYRQPFIYSTLRAIKRAVSARIIQSERY